MEYLKDWLRSILYLNLFLLVFEQLVPEEKYGGYLRFFSGFLLMLCLLKPLVDLSGLSGRLDASLLQEELAGQLAVLGDTGEYEGMAEAIREEYRASVEAQITALVEEEGFSVEKITLSFGDGEELKKVRLVVRDAGEGDIEGRKKEVTESLIAFYQLKSRNIHIKEG